MRESAFGELRTRVHKPDIAPCDICSKLGLHIPPPPSLVNTPTSSAATCLPATGKITVGEKIGFSLGDAACHIVFDNVMFYMMFFYTDIYKIPAAFVGTLFLAARILDAISDPIIGLASDRTRTRWGKFRPYVLFGAIPFGLICTLTYTTPNFGETGKLIYAAGTYTLLMLVFSLVNVPYCSLGDTITDDPKERISLQTWRFVLSGISGMFSTVLLMPLVNWIGGEKAHAFTVGIGMLSVVAVVMLFICFATTHERVRSSDDGFSSSMRLDMLALLRNDQWRIAGVLNIFNIMQWSVRGGGMVYYVTYFLGDAKLFTAFLAAYSIGSIFGVTLAKPLTSRFCKVKVFTWTNGILCVLSLSLFFIPIRGIHTMYVFTFLIGLLHQMMTPIQWVMISDTVDYGEWKDGKRLTGVSFASMLFVFKLGLALSGALIGWILSAVAYQPGAVAQGPAAMKGILCLFTLGPAAIYLASVIVCRYYKLRGSYFEQITRELHQRRTEVA